MTKLKDLSPDQQSEFHRIIGAAVKTGKKAPDVQDELASSVGKAFGQRMIQRYIEKRKQGVIDCASLREADEREHMTLKGTGSETAELSGVMQARIVTLEDALQKGNVDLDKWDVDRWEITSWEVGAKAKSNLTYNSNNQLVEVDKQLKVTPLWRVNVKLKAKKGWNPSEFREILLADMRKLAPTYEKIERKSKAEPTLLELSVFDAHFGKLAWAPETGQDYDIRICKNRYMKACRDLLSRGEESKPERILYVVGNDFFHCDHKGMTTSGTPMDVDGRWQKAFRIGKDCCITVIEEATQIAPVDVLVVPGNHDREKAFCLGEVLDARFHLNHDVNVMNDPDPFSYYRWGKVLLGFNHGEEYASDKKRTELPIQMSTDRPVDWSETVWREIHLGHFHSEDEMVWRYRSAKQIRDITVRTLPSLSSTDAWHRVSGYASPLAAEAHVYHKSKGRYNYLIHQTEG